MKARAQKVQRILAVQNQIHRIEKWRMAELQNRIAELEADRLELIGALNEENALHGIFLDMMARRLRSIVQDIDRTTTEHDLQALTVMEKAARVRLAERLSQSVNQYVRRAEDRKQLSDVIERFVDWARTSLP